MTSAIFEPTQHAAFSRLSQFVPSAGRHYQNSRNADLGPENRSNVSALSPYIRHRLITEENVLRAVLEKHSLSASEKFVQEVFWRTYFKGHLETRPAIWSNYCNALKTMKVQGGLQKAYDAAIAGRTGIECFDAWVAELIEIGYLHNHTRMWFASIWIFTLRLPWELGADFMYRHLLDGDPASNTLSWRWVGGLHTKGKTYLARPDNIETYTQGRFSPTGLAREALALEEPALPSAQKIPAAADHFSGGIVGLLLTEEDLQPETWDLRDVKVAAVAGTSSVDARSDLPVAKLVQDFTASAVADGVQRSAQKFNCPQHNLALLDTKAVVAWAGAHDLKTIVTGYAPVGPVAELLASLTPNLKKQGVTLVQLRRPIDTAAWPYGTRGFFAMKEKIPKLLEHFEKPETAQLSLV